MVVVQAGHVIHGRDRSHMAGETRAKTWTFCTPGPPLLVAETTWTLYGGLDWTATPLAIAVVLYAVLCLCSTTQKNNMTFKKVKKVNFKIGQAGRHGEKMISLRAKTKMLVKCLLSQH